MADVSTTFGSTGTHHRAPGIYIQETAPTPGPLMVTGVPLFIGFARIRPDLLEQRESEGPQPLRISRWDQFETSIESTASGSFLRYAVRGFFANGGERCVVLPLPVSDQEPLGALRKLFQKEMYREDHRGLRGVLDDIDDVDLVCVPDIMMETIRQSEGTVFDLQKQVLEYCKDMGERFAILDPLRSGSDAAAVEESVQAAIRQWQHFAASEGALYFPWIRVKSLNGDGEEWVPPCGHIAGIYARTDTRLGFHKAPANELLESVLDLEVQVSDDLSRELNDVGVNCLRSFARRGIRLWGARTLSGHREWRYVNVRRVFLSLVRWIHHATSDLVFEPNDPFLWDRVHRRITTYCYELFERGALKGRDPAEAFFVKCDGELNPPEVRDLGQVICDIGLAPLRPAEFIIVRITQSAAGATITLAPA
jgi:uncharacterized protein